MVSGDGHAGDGGDHRTAHRGDRPASDVGDRRASDLGNRRASDLGDRRAVVWNAPVRCAPPGPVTVDTAGAVAAAETAAAAFDPARLTLARERNGLTRKALAELLGLSPAAVTGFERRHARPSGETLQAAAAALGLPVTYFAAGRPMVRLGDAHFRSVRSTRVYERDQARAAMSHLAELVRVIEQVVRLPRLRLPTVPPVPEEAARQVRQAWELPGGPVHHLIRLMESKGIVFSMIGFGTGDRLDAFSCHPHGLSRPLVCLSRERGDVLRRRFSAAHELGHLVLHPRAVPGSAEHEHEADRFAAEFLGPAAELVDALPPRLDLACLLQMQSRWGLSVQSLLRRSLDLRVIDERTYRTGMATLGRLGRSRHRPGAGRAADIGAGGGSGADSGGGAGSGGSGATAGGRLTGEWPSLLREAVQLASLQGLTEEALAAGLHLPMTELRELLSHVMDDRPRLRLVPPPPGGPTG